MNVTESLQAIDAWLLEHGVTEEERPAPASSDALTALSKAGSGDVTAELKEFYGRQNGLPHWFTLYDTWQFLTLEKAFDLQGTLVKSSAHLGKQEQWQQEWLPILTNNGGDYCFQDLQQGGLDFYSHLDGERVKVSPSLEEFLEHLVQEIQEGQYVFEDDEPTYTGTHQLGHG